MHTFKGLNLHYVTDSEVQKSRQVDTGDTGHMGLLWRTAFTEEVYFRPVSTEWQRNCCSDV